MLVTPGKVLTRIDQLRLSYDGYSRQLKSQDLSQDRRSTLEAEASVYSQEIATLEKILSVMRAEPDTVKVERVLRDRIAIVRDRIAADPSLGDLHESHRENTSGEARALLWALGEDTLSASVREVVGDRASRGPAGAAQAVAMILITGLRTGFDPNARASAAYELGVLHITEAIPHLAAVLPEGGAVAEMALLSLTRFSDEELSAAELYPELLHRVRLARSSR